MGYFSRQDVPACSISPDGMFALLEREVDGSYKFVGLCVLEIKTQSALGTVDAVYRQSLNGNKFTECATGKTLFKERFATHYIGLKYASMQQLL